MSEITPNVYERFISEVEALSIKTDWAVAHTVGELTRAVKRAQMSYDSAVLDGADPEPKCEHGDGGCFYCDNEPTHIETTPGGRKIAVCDGHSSPCDIPGACARMNRKCDRCDPEPTITREWLDGLIDELQDICGVCKRGGPDGEVFDACDRHDGMWELRDAILAALSKEGK